MRYVPITIFIGGCWLDNLRYDGSSNIHEYLLDENTSTIEELCDIVRELEYNLEKLTFAYSRDFQEIQKVEILDDNGVKEFIRVAKSFGYTYLYVEGITSDDNNEDGSADGFDDAEVVDDIGARMAIGESDEEEEDEVSFRVGQTFDSRDCFKEAIFKYAVKYKMDLELCKSEKMKVGAVCRSKDCKWRVYGSLNSTSPLWTVRTYINTHTCSRDGRVKMFSAKKIAEHFKDEFRSNPNLSAADMKTRLAVERILVSKDKCQAARKICRDELKSEFEKQFERLEDYVYELRRSNPESTVILDLKGNVFNRLYICFAAQRIVWMNACRKVIHLDGTFLRGSIQGELLTAVGRDANNQVYPIAWAVVPVENMTNWKWFLTLLQVDLRFGEEDGLVLMSDKQKGLILAIEKVCPNVEHRMCAIHIWANLKKKYGDNASLHFYFWKAARAYTSPSFQAHMRELCLVRHEAHADLMRVGGSHWARSFFSGVTKCDVVENNMSESFNAVITHARTKHIVPMLEDICKLVMRSNDEKARVVNNYIGPITPWAREMLDKAKQISLRCKVCRSGRRWYLVEHESTKFEVNVRGEVSCTCRRYELSGIPCAHIISALWADYEITRVDERRTPEELVAPWFSYEMWKRTYDRNLMPTNGMNLWINLAGPGVLPPPLKKMPGRPKKKRVRNVNPLDDEDIPRPRQPRQGMIMICRRCLQARHNVRTCVNPVAHPPSQSNEGASSSAALGPGDLTQE